MRGGCGDRERQHSARTRPSLEETSYVSGANLSLSVCARKPRATRQLVMLRKCLSGRMLAWSDIYTPPPLS